MNTKYDTICMSGGGIKGFAFIGALKYLENNNHINLSEINHFIGTSAGSMLSFFLSLDYSLKEIEDFIISFNFKKIIPDFNIENLLLNHGLDCGDKIMFVIMNFLKEKYDTDDVTFQEHYNLTNNKLTIIGTNFTKNCEEVFNYINTPNMSVRLAIRISISIPILFNPVLYNDNYYIDGGIINNFPMNHCNPETTLGLYIKSVRSKELDNILTLFNGCLSIIIDTLSTKHFCHLKNYNIIEIEDCNAELINFDIDNEKKQNIINIGITYAEQFLKKYNEKKEIVNIDKNKDSSTQTEIIKITQDSSTQTD
jgi:predicted patatin/cPLA2 family phospholipase